MRLVKRDEKVSYKMRRKDVLWNEESKKDVEGEVTGIYQ